MIFHITDRGDWEAAEAAGRYAPPSLGEEGFIHFSTAAQVHGTLRNLFAGRHGLVMLRVDPDRLDAELKYEESEPGQLFPHLYGPLNLDAVTDVQELTVATWER